MQKNNPDKKNILARAPSLLNTWWLLWKREQDLTCSNGTAEEKQVLLNTGSRHLCRFLSNFLDYLSHSTSGRNENRKAISFMPFIFPLSHSCWFYHWERILLGLIRPFVNESQKTTGSSVKSHTWGKEIQTTSHQGELVFPPLVLQEINY